MYIGLHVKYMLFCQVLMKLEYYGLSFKKYSNIKFHENPSVGAELFHADGQRHDKANSRVSIFCEGA